MAELIAVKQPLTAVGDQEDQLRKGDEYERRAANELKGWAVFSGDYEIAIQCLERACSFYKPAKACKDPCRFDLPLVTLIEDLATGGFHLALDIIAYGPQFNAAESASVFLLSRADDKLAGAHMKIARCHLKVGNVEEGATTYAAAAKFYRKIGNQGAVTCLSRAAMLFEEIEQLSAAGRYYQELGDIAEGEGKGLQAIQHFQKASDLYTANESRILSNQCKTKAAKQAAELERYVEAIDLFEVLGKEAVSTGASKKTAREMFVYVGLCLLCSQQHARDMKSFLKSFQEMDPDFSVSRENKILVNLATALEKRNRSLYVEVLSNHEVFLKHDPLARLLANRALKKLKSLPAVSKSTCKVVTENADASATFDASCLIDSPTCLKAATG